MQIFNFRLEAYVQFNEGTIDNLLCRCEEIIENMTSDERARFKLKSALHELIVNSLEHGYKKKGGKVSISLVKENGNIVLQIADEGSGLDTSSINFQCKSSDEIDSLSARGWGLFLTSQMSESFKICPNTPSGTMVSVTITA